MEACVVVCRTQKPKARRGKILFINAVNEVTRERAQSFLTDEHLQRIVRAYQDFKDEPGFTRVVPARRNPGQGRQPEHSAVCRNGNAGAQFFRYQEVERFLEENFKPAEEPAAKGGQS
jgi:hypothetical protein